MIAGGGIAGLAVALGLARRRRASMVFEQAPAFEEVGAGLQMSPNGVRALQALGAWEAVEPACVIPSEIHVRDGRSSALLQRIRLGKPFEQRFGAPYRVCHRADLLHGLLDRARSNDLVALHNGRRVIAAKLESDSARLEFDDGSAEHGMAIIAADGIRSRLRKMASDAAPIYRGHAIFRSLIPFGAVPPGIEADCVTLWLYPGGHVVHYPVSNWNSFNIVAAIDHPAAAEGWNAPSDGSELRDALADADEPLAQLLAKPASWLKWQGADLPSLPRWAKDNLVLVGDAAHATLPYLAQGAVMGLEDACVLARRVSDAKTPAEAFAGFAGERQVRTDRIQAESRRLGQLYHARGAIAAVRNLGMRVLGSEAALGRNRWVYDWQA